MSDPTNPGDTAGTTLADSAPAPKASKPRAPLALAALVIGIIAMVSAIIPILSFVAFVPALTALGLGIAAMVRQTPRRAQAISGIMLGALSFVVAISVSVGTAGMAASSVSDQVDSGENTPTIEEPAAAPEPEPVPEPEPEPTEAPEPEPEPIPADVVYQGTGDSIVPIELPDGADSAAVATVSHNGSRNFAVWSLDEAMGQQDLLVNTIGGYQGTVLFNDEAGSTTAAFEISADGAWTVTVRPLLSVREFSGPAATGLGDDVVIYRGQAGASIITHDGARNFAVWTYGASTDLVVNEIGPYTGTVRWTAGPSLVEVSADGNWTISVG